MSQLADQLWEALKRECCKGDPIKANLIVFLSEEKFKKAVTPLLPRSDREIFFEHLEAASKEVSTWEPLERDLLNG